MQNKSTQTKIDLFEKKKINTAFLCTYLIRFLSYFNYFSLNVYFPLILYLLLLIFKCYELLLLFNVIYRLFFISCILKLTTNQIDYNNEKKCKERN